MSVPEAREAPVAVRLDHGRCHAFRLTVLRDGCEAFPGLVMEAEAGWLTRASRDMGGRRDCRLLDVARNVLGSD